MSKKNNTIAYVLLGAAVFLMLSRRNQQPPPQQFQPGNYPPPPPRTNAQQYAQWAQTMLNLYGTVSALWQPGGPFYGRSQSEIYNTIDQYSPGTTQGPGFDPTGWV